VIDSPSFWKTIHSFELKVRQLSAQLTGNALYGLQNLSSEHVEAVLELELKLTECGD
jgi:hypothetical protein